MGLFDRHSRHVKGTTKGFYLGSPEAEGECRDNNQNLISFFVDIMDIFEKIGNGKFIISGRKGAGKTAIAKYITDSSGEENASFNCIVKSNEFQLEKLIQSIPEEKSCRYEILFEWIILTRFVTLITKTDICIYTREIRVLKEFLKKNSGIIEIDQYQVAEASVNKKDEVNFSPLKGLFNMVLSRFYSLKEIKASYYNFIPCLRDVVMKVLSFDAFKGYEFSVLFDDLDVNFKLSSKDDKAKLLDLIRIAKRYNVEYLKGTKSRVLIFIRDDVERRLNGIDSDKNKIFGTYSYRINWYNIDVNEREIWLRKFINKRLEINFRNLGCEYDQEDPWLSFVDNNVCAEYNYKSAFRYILDYTFYRPRDLVNIFKDIGEHSWQLPLEPMVIKQLLKKYVQTNIGEITDELAISFEQQEIEAILEILNVVSKYRGLSYEDLTKEVQRRSLDSSSVIPLLLSYDLIVPKDVNGNLYFSYREQPLLKPLEEYTYVLPNCLYAYFRPYLLN